MRLYFTLIATTIFFHAWGFSNYDAHIWKAEDALCSGRIQLALRNYDRAYRIVGVAMPSTTLYNFFIASIDGKRYSKARKLLAELKQRGWTLEEYQSHLAPYFRGAEMERLNRLYKESKTSGTSTIDLIITHKIDSLVAIDQEVDNYRYTLAENSKERAIMDDSFVTLTSNNVTALRGILNRSYPSDRELGKSNGPFSGLPYHVVLLHASQMKLGIHLLDSILYRATLDKKLIPADFEYYLSMEPKDQGYVMPVSVGNMSFAVPMNPYSFAVINDSLFKFPVSAAKIDSCDNERKKVKGLYSCKQLEARIQFDYYNPKYALLSNIEYPIRFSYTLPNRIKRQLVYVPNKY